MTKAIIFDCFGVLVTDAVTAIIDDHAIDHPEEAAQIEAIYEDSNRGKITRKQSGEKVAKILGVETDEYHQMVIEGEVKNTKLMSYILELRKKGYKTAILSNVSPGGLAFRFTSIELKEHFDVVVSSGDLGYAKPEAQAYETAAARLDVLLTECIMIDDIEAYCLGATGVGMKAIQYVDFEQMKKDLEDILDRESG